MTARFRDGASVNLKDGRYRIPATVERSFESFEGHGKTQWHGITYDLKLHGGNEGQSAEGVRENKLEAK